MESESLSRWPEPSVWTVAGVSCDGQSKPALPKATRAGTLTINMTGSRMTRLDNPKDVCVCVCVCGGGASVQGLQGSRLGC